MQSQKYSEQIGRRKTATTRVRLFEGDANSTINGKDYAEYVHDKVLQIKLEKPLKLCDAEKKYYFTAKALGGGISGQAEAVALGIARNLAKISADYCLILKKEKLLTRDPRMVERKKYFFIKARKKPQYSKR